jgi:hypothetical protein
MLPFFSSMFLKLYYEMGQHAIIYLTTFKFVMLTILEYYSYMPIYMSFGELYSGVNCGAKAKGNMPVIIEYLALYINISDSKPNEEESRWHGKVKLKKRGGKNPSHCV